MPICRRMSKILNEAVSIPKVLGISVCFIVLTERQYIITEVKPECQSRLNPSFQCPVYSPKDASQKGLRTPPLSPM